MTTEPETGQVHSVFFNRGAAASQEYAHRFGTVPNENNPNDPRWAWLSRGAMEAMTAFLARATDDTWGLRVAAYEFRLKAFADQLKAAADRGVDVRVLYDACANRPDSDGVVFPRDLNLAWRRPPVWCRRCRSDRITRSDVLDPPIAHHKFIVLTHNGQAEALLTGSTNFSLGGVFGQSNVVHVVNDAPTAASYLQLWTDISVNPVHATLKQQLQRAQPDSRRATSAAAPRSRAAAPARHRHLGDLQPAAEPRRAELVRAPGDDRQRRADDDLRVRHAGAVQGRLSQRPRQTSLRTARQADPERHADGAAAGEDRRDDPDPLHEGEPLRGRQPHRGEQLRPLGQGDG